MFLVTIKITEEQSARPRLKFIVIRVIVNSFVDLKWWGTQVMGWYIRHGWCTRDVGGSHWEGLELTLVQFCERFILNITCISCTPPLNHFLL